MNIWIIKGFVIFHALCIVFGITGVVTFITACVLTVSLFIELTKFVYNLIESLEVHITRRNNE